MPSSSGLISAARSDLRQRLRVPRARLARVADGDVLLDRRLEAAAPFERSLQNRDGRGVVAVVHVCDALGEQLGRTHPGKLITQVLRFKGSQDRSEPCAT